MSTTSHVSMKAMETEALDQLHALCNHYPLDFLIGTVDVFIFDIADDIVPRNERVLQRLSRKYPFLTDQSQQLPPVTYCCELSNESYIVAQNVKRHLREKLTKAFQKLILSDK